VVVAIWKEGNNVRIDVNMPVAKYELLLSANEEHLSPEDLINKLIDEYLASSERR
jgi:hypothetical protein